MSRSFTIKEAKEHSTIKWEQILKLTRMIYDMSVEPCGFCILEELTETKYECKGCLVNEKCLDAYNKVSTLLNDIAFYIVNDLLPFIEKFKENKE